MTGEAQEDPSRLQFPFNWILTRDEINLRSHSRKSRLQEAQKTSRSPSYDICARNGRSTTSRKVKRSDEGPWVVQR